MQQTQSQDVPSEPVATVSTSPEVMVVLDDEVLSQVVGGAYAGGPGGGWCLIRYRPRSGAINETGVEDLDSLR